MADFCGDRNKYYGSKTKEKILNTWVPTERLGEVIHLRWNVYGAPVPNYLGYFNDA